MVETCEDIETLLPTVKRAVSSVLRSRPHLRHEYDDLVGEGNLALVKALQRPDIDDLPDYVFRSARRAMVRYLERLPIVPAGYRPAARLTERELLLRRSEALEDILAVCDDLDRQIVTRRDDGDTLVEIAGALDLDKSTVSRKLSAIFVRYRATLEQ